MKELLQSIRRELIHIKKRPRYIILLTAGIVFSYVFFLTLMNEGQPQKLPIAIVDQDGSYLSRRLCHEINATQGVEIVAVYDNHSQTRDAMQRQQIFAFLEIPANTYSDILAFKRPHIALYANNAYLLAGSFTYKSLATISKLASGAVQREILRKKGYDEKRIAGIIQPIELDIHSISNPTTNYQPYILTTILPGIVGIMVLLITIFVLYITIQREPTPWLATANGKILPAVVGTLLPYTFWFSLILILGNITLFGIFNYPLLGSFWIMVILSILFIIAMQAMGILLTAILTEMHIAVCIGAIYGTLAFTMSGFSYPATSMHPALQGFSYIFPLRHYYLTFVDVALYDASTHQYIPHLAYMTLFMVAGLIGCIVLTYRLKGNITEATALAEAK